MNNALASIDMSPGKLLDVGHSFGFKILARKQRLKLDLDAGHELGMEGFVAALIESGVATEDAILKEVRDVTGQHSEALVKHVIAAGEAHVWNRAADGALSMIRN